jgi:hypothetical protein
MGYSHLKIGLPLLGSVLLGSFGLQYMMQSKIDYEQQKKDSV